MYIDEKLIKLLEPHNESKIDVSYAIRLINIVAKEYDVEQSTLTDVSGMFSEKQMEQAWTNGCECGESRSGYFDIENYS